MHSNGVVYTLVLLLLRVVLFIIANKSLKKEREREREVGSY